MPDIRLTRFIARKARDAAKAASGAKPSHISEAIAAGLDYASHASLLASVATAPYDGIPRPWDGKAATSRLDALCPSLGHDVAARAAVSAGEVLAGIGRDGFDRLAEIVERVMDDGGGAIHLEGGPGHAGVRVVPARKPGPYRKLPPGISWDLLTSSISGTPTESGTFAFDPKPEVFLAGASLHILVDRLQAASPLGHGPGSIVERVAFLPNGLFGLPRDAAPVAWGAIAIPSLGLRPFLDVPPRIACHRGLASLSEALGDATPLDALRRATARSGGLRVVYASLGRGGPAVARACALSSEGSGGFIDATSLDGIDLAILPLDLSGTVVLMPPLLNLRGCTVAKALVGRQAAVWTSVYTGMGPSMRTPGPAMRPVQPVFALHIGQDGIAASPPGHP